MESEV